MTGQVVVIGLGNAMRGDDAAGLHAARRLAHEPGVAVRMHEGEGVGLLDLWADADVVIVVDAVRSGAPPGTIHRMDASTQPLPTAVDRASSHAIGAAAAIELARALDSLPARVVFYGVEGSDFALGAALSPPVAEALDPLVRAVRGEIGAHSRPRKGQRFAAPTGGCGTVAEP